MMIMIMIRVGRAKLPIMIRLMIGEHYSPG